VNIRHDKNTETRRLRDASVYALATDPTSSVRRIAEQLGMSKSNVRRVLALRGIAKQRGRQQYHPCGHAPHYAKGLCKKCYDEARRAVPAIRDKRHEQLRVWEKASRAWDKVNPKKRQALNRKRKARKLGQTVHYTPQELETLKRQLNYKCVGCGRTETELKALGRILVGDHIIALSNGGLDSIENIQPLCHSRGKGSTWGCNNRKHTKTKDFLIS
jgi:hypothetical protein